jgi:hypothetical protein
LVLSLKDLNMTQLALDITAVEVASLSKIETASYTNENDLRMGAAFIAAVTLGLIQVLDGVLTYIGITHFGAWAEGNAMIRAMVVLFGPLPALVGVKLVAIAIIMSLYRCATTVKWIPQALTLITVVYMVFAIIPWCAILAPYLF